MSVILKDIREKHKADTPTVDENSHVAEVQKQLQEAMSFEGSPQEKQARIFCNRLGIPYDTLTKEDLLH